MIGFSESSSATDCHIWGVQCAVRPFAHLLLVSRFFSAYPLRLRASAV